MNHETPSDFALDMIEHEASVAAANINAALGEVDASVEFDFCEGCPRLGSHAPEEAKEAEKRIGWSLSCGGGFNGALISMELAFKDGTKSDPMLLAAYGGNMFTENMIDHAQAKAAQRTQECPGAKKFPRILGPLGVKKCPVIPKYTGL